MSYELNSFVNRQEAEALKELIFKRAKERANKITDDFHAEIMNIARESFVSNNNPFSQTSVQTAEKSAPANSMHETEKTSALHKYTEIAEKQAEEVGFPLKKLAQGLANQNKIIKEQITAAQVQNTMIEAREGLSNKKSFMGALAFLNSHAAASLLNQRNGHGVDFVA